MIPDHLKKPPAPQDDIIITANEAAWVSKKGKLLPCPIGKFGVRLASMLGEPGAQFAYLVARQLDYYRSSVEDYAHNEFTGKVTMWGAAASETGKDVARAAGQETGLYDAKTAPYVPPPIPPPRIIEPERPSWEVLCQVIENGCLARGIYYTSPMPRCGYAFRVGHDLNLWWMDEDCCVMDYVGYWWATSNVEAITGPAVLPANQYFYMEVGEWEWVPDGESRYTGDHWGAFSTDGHCWLFLEEHEIVYGPGWYYPTGHVVYAVREVYLKEGVSYFRWKNLPVP